MKSNREGKNARNGARRNNYKSVSAQANNSNNSSNINKRPKTNTEVIAEGGIPIQEEYLRIYCLLCYQCRFEEPDESEWGTIAGTIRSEIGCSVNTVKRVFREPRDGKLENALKRKPGSGAPRKISADNPGLIAAAMALNVGVPPSLATETCNANNVSAASKFCWRAQ